MPHNRYAARQKEREENKIFYVVDKFGFISAFQKVENYEGELITKAMHCVDIREALPFKTYEEAEQTYKRLGGGWRHCVVNTNRPEVKE